MVSPAQIDKYLIKRAVAGDSDAFGRLYSSYLDAIYRYIYFRVGDPADAEDLTELVFLKAYEALPNYQEFGNPFSSWLYRIAHNVVIDFHRREKPYVPDLESFLEERQDGAVSALGSIIETEELAELAKAVSQLSSEQQQVIILRFIEGLSHAQISNIIGKNEGACRMIQHRALVALSNLLDGNDRKNENEQLT